ncbi:putative endopeptidase [Aliiruegeria haliotis]|uniref:Putative endopeptidase n=1 Tax=Aliiruegeria haliotis TaxID=1280846 RepID=A0A2T0RYY9_9RHOB|nr:M13 family metallopeptidase [Aliiruegeria haliotis]PRY26406.1 putative endopeptidase [Aliiruegeria haliotis]
MRSKTALATGLASAFLTLPTGVLGQAADLPPAGPDDLVFSVENMDTSIDPAVDFYRYASGKWLDRVERPSHLAAYGALTIAAERTKERMKIALAEAGRTAADAPKGSPVQLVGDFYNAYMDTAALDAAGLDPLTTELERIEAIRTMDDLVRFVGGMLDIGGPSLLLSFGPDVDLANSKAYATYGGAGSFGVPKEHAEILRQGPGAAGYAAYRTYVEAVMQIAGRSEAEAARIAETVLQLESAMLAAQLTPEEKIDPRVFYNPMPVEEVQAQIPELDLATLFDVIDFPLPETIIVAEPRYLPALSQLLRERPIGDFRNYFTFRLIDNYTDVLTTEFDEPHRAFNAALTGVEEQLPREERALAFLKEALGHPLSQVYINQFYADTTRDKTLDMIDRIQAVFIDRLPSRDWLSEETRAEALNKLENLYYKVGYPDEWIDYSSVEIGPDAVSNIRNIAAFLADRIRERSRGPVTHDQFNTESTLPIVVNAAYNPTYNGFEVPAAIQQPPVFDASADAPVRFCRLGAIIGHEMTHGLDSGGRRFDAEGNLRDWWTFDDGVAFVAEAKKLVEQADAVEIRPGLHLNGPLNVGENMADVGGITFAHEALMRYLDEHPDENVEIDGLTPSQRCFIAWAQMWTWKASEQFIQTIVTGDRHPPSEYRAYAPLQHLEAFYEAFDIGEGDPMWLPPEQRVNAW